VGLIFVCGFFWSLFDLSRKRMGHSMPVFQALFLFMWVQLPVFLLGAVWVQAYSVDSAYWGIGLLGVLINFMGNALFIASISRAPLSHTIPMLSFACVVSAIVSYFLLGEHLGIRQVGGILLITLGAFFLNGIPSFREKEKSGAWLMALAAVFWGTMSAVDKICLQLIHPTLHAAVQTAGIGILATLILWKKGELLVAIKNAPPQIFNLSLGTLGSSAAILSQLYIIQFVAVGLFEAVKRVFAMTLSVIWGHLLYKERISFNKFLSLMLMGVGLLLLLVSPAVQAQETQKWDASLDVGLRAYPSGAALGFEGGRSQVLWGDSAANSEGDYQYGYFRLGGRVQTSIVVNGVEAKLSLFPISFVGLELSAGLSHRNLEQIGAIDCESVDCKGTLRRTRLSLPLYLGVDRVFGRVRGSFQWVEKLDSQQTLAGDEKLVLPIVAAGDEVLSGDLLFGYSFNDSQKLMAFIEANKTRQSEASSLVWGLIGELGIKTQPEQKFYLGLGLYDSSLIAPHGQVFIAYSLSFKKGLGF